MKTDNNDELYGISEISISYRPKFKNSDRPEINCSKDAYRVLFDTWDKDKLQLLEQGRMLLLNSTGRLLGIVNLSTGTTDATIMDMKLIFGTALKAAARKVIISHNHPSGSLKPSENDLNITCKMRDAGQLLDIQLDDHLIITAEGYYSFADEELL